MINNSIEIIVFLSNSRILVRLRTMQNNNPENKSNNFLFSQTRIRGLIISPRQLSKDYIILVALLFSEPTVYKLLVYLKKVTQFFL